MKIALFITYMDWIYIICTFACLWLHFSTGVISLCSTHSHKLRPWNRLHQYVLTVKRNDIKAHFHVTLSHDPFNIQFHNPKSLNSGFRYLHLRLSSVWSSGSLARKYILDGGFAVSCFLKQQFPKQYLLYTCYYCSYHFKTVQPYHIRGVFKKYRTLFFPA
jgi:hypothetical protein